MHSIRAVCEACGIDEVSLQIQPIIGGQNPDSGNSLTKLDVMCKVGAHPQVDVRSFAMPHAAARAHEKQSPHDGVAGGTHVVAKRRRKSPQCALCAVIGFVRHNARWSPCDITRQARHVVVKEPWQRLDEVATAAGHLHGHPLSSLQVVGHKPCMACRENVDVDCRRRVRDRCGHWRGD